MHGQRLDRAPGWRSRLIDYVEGVRGTRFRWGKMDCGIFSSGAVEAMTGFRPIEPVEGYKTHRQLVERLSALGFDGPGAHADFVASIFSEIPPAMAQEGDIVETGDHALGILQGPMVYQMSPSGLGLTPRSAVKRAFAV